MGVKPYNASLIRKELTMGVARNTILKPAFLISKNFNMYIGSITTIGNPNPYANKNCVDVMEVVFDLSSFVFSDVVGSISILYTRDPSIALKHDCSKITAISCP
mmetsp:Transcript_30376/g.65565  ORF Transcript_30376/g.65565 Transcript_30376/m.65565 type:complete len:104 (-) Transcript_30376:92-403(-)